MANAKLVPFIASVRFKMEELDAKTGK